MSVYFSMPGFFDGVQDHFDSSGHCVGFSMDGLIADQDHFNSEGQYAGFTMEGPLGYDEVFNSAGGYEGFVADGLLADQVGFFPDDGFVNF